jgi:hypothetical protein
MTGSGLFIELPHVEWHGAIPFAYARLSEEYAHCLELSAHRHLDVVSPLPTSTIGAPDPATNAPAARYASYNVFLLGPEFLPLFVAIHRTYRTLLQAMGSAPIERFIKCWYNITSTGTAMPRHQHRAPIIGTFAARAEGSTTSFGMQSQATVDDLAVANRDGQLILTVGMNHFHQVSTWRDESTDRVTYAFDIIGHDQWRADRVQVPFDNSNSGLLEIP